MNNITQFSNNSSYSVSLNTNLSWHMNNYHYHQRYEIYFSLSNNIKFFVTDKIYNVKKGDLFVFNQTDLHKSIAINANTKYERYVLHFDSTLPNFLSTKSTNLLDCFINRDKNFSYCVHLSLTQSQILINLFKKAHFYCTYDDYGKEVHQKITLAEILLFVNSMFDSLERVAPDHHNKDLNRILPILKYIQENLKEDLSLDNLSSKFYLSKSYFSRIFKRSCGFTVNQYIVNRRIIKAMELLKRGHSVTETCENVGFNNVSHFIRTFSRMMNISPKQFAKKVK